MALIVIIGRAFSFQFPSVYHLDDVSVCSALVGLTVLRVFEKYLVHVGAGVLVQFVVGIEYDKSDLTFTQYTQLISFLHQSKFTFRKRHLPVALIIDSLNVNLLASHD